MARAEENSGALEASVSVRNARASIAGGDDLAR